MRGTHSRWKTAVVPLGIIPAYAGNTTGCRPRRRWCRDHPRVCGEHLGSAHRGPLEQGSSPRMRGTLVEQVAPCGINGIIPAYAGNTWDSRICAKGRGDHPRVCGEHSTPFSVCVWLTGSSPRMRGTRLDGIASEDGRGIIPAYAGNTSGSGITTNSPRDHPRVCGEHEMACCDMKAAMGSSPRMRGTHA